MTSVVSVVIPAYNPGSFLVEALASVVAQDYSAWECVVVDDGSSEDLSWVDEVDPRTRLIRRTNRGPAAARNTGVAATHGEYIAFLDADDIWRPDKLGRQVALLEKNVLSVLCNTGAELIDERGHVLCAWPYAGQIRDYADLVRGSDVGVSSALIRRTSFIEAGGWNMFQRVAEDLDLWLRLSLLGSFSYDEKTLAQYRRHEGNLSANAALMATGVDAVLCQHERLARQRQDTELLGSIRAARRAARRGWGATAFDQARRELSQGHVVQCAHHWKNAFRLNPRYTLRASRRSLVRELLAWAPTARARPPSSGSNDTSRELGVQTLAEKHR